MSASLIIGAVFVVASALVALLPIRRQMWPGGTLLLAAPFVLGFIGYQHGWIWLAVGLAVFVSMFRNPLRYVLAKARGQNPELPK
jgi:hypothetical protein